MPNILLTKFTEWIDQNKSKESSSVISLLEDIGYTNILWMILSQNEIHILDYSDAIGKEAIELIKKKKNFAKIKDWMKDTLQDNIIQLGNSSRNILYISKDNFGNIEVVLSDQNTGLNQADVRNITKMAIQYIKSQQKINTLENALRLSVNYSSKSHDISKLSNITTNTLKPSFIKDVVPHLFYSYVHEAYGPLIYESVPDEMKLQDHIITAVKIFSGLDADMIAEVGHVFTTNPIAKPVLGDLFTIVFTLPNQDARGNFEVHSVSILIPQEFSNLSKEFMGEFKTKLFAVAEQFRMEHEVENWNLAVGSLNKNNSINNSIQDALITLRGEIALVYALQMDPQVVLSW